MSEVKTNKLTGVSTANDITVTVGATATQSLHDGLTKAFASFNQHASGHPVYSDSSINTASTTDIAAGVTKIAFTTSFTNSTYAISGVTQAQDTGGAIFQIWGYSTTSSRQMTTSDFHTDFRNTGGSNVDSDYTAFKVLGDLA